ncbi:MAG: sodium:proton antiporter [Bifidobacteriaceae bacterium]|jgi:Na+/H+ antiporter NhaD/arsenite permease-like protein|nr:sodium:proton antiporter [Bifidobacteriaceae bacterium]
MTLPSWSILPFITLLGCIAVLPLIRPAARHWERNRSKLVISLALGLPVGLWVWFELDPHLVEHSMAEYGQFIVLLASLFVVSGGIFLDGDLPATPRNNTIFLALGAVLASFIGTTGAAMLLIRPLLNTNAERRNKTHTVVFAIFIVANCGGLLTPLGDPPLYVGLMRGVPFTWTFSLIGPWVLVNGLLLLTYYALDRRRYAAEAPQAIASDNLTVSPLALRGGLNCLWLALIIASVAFLGTLPWLRAAVQIGVAAASYFLTPKVIRFGRNEFSWRPIIEVAVLFLGIFLTMIPALALLQDEAHRLPLNEYTFFGLTGGLSAILDNTPTYLAFFGMGQALTVPGAVTVAGVPEIYLTAISLGAVTCGAVTYIGNGPNFMVKAVAEERGIEMPSFGGFIVWAVKYLIPILAAMVCLFISPLWPVRLAGGLLASFLAARPVVSIVRDRRQALGLPAA